MEEETVDWGDEPPAGGAEAEPDEVEPEEAEPDEAELDEAEPGREPSPQKEIYMEPKAKLAPQQ